MTFKKITGVLHLWLGLTCGLVVCISMFAAAIFVWDAELTSLFYHKELYVKEKKAEILPTSELIKSAKKALPGKNIYGMQMYRDGSRTYEFSSYKDCDTCSGWTQWSNTEYWDAVYVDPYTGEVTGTIDMMANWIQLSRRLHQNLLLRYEVGHYIVGYATLIVLILVITGLILWFPKNKAAFKQRFKIKFDAKWRRVNYDIHNVGGFYTWLLIFIFAVTGLVWTFEWWTNGIYRILGSDPEKVYAEHIPLKIKGEVLPGAMDHAIGQLSTLRPSWETAYVNLQEKQNDTISEIDIYLSFNTHSGWDEGDEYHFHPITGQLLSSSLQENKTLGAKWRNSNYSIHVGSIYGLPTKILATFAALFLASLPVTGFLIWLGRKKKDKKGKTEKPKATTSKKSNVVIPARK